ncbi:MAG: aminopeptidase, partial [Elusimicrobiales bacterium]|nr:aminopeptidase [Elusimicrobiales bacterium]
MQIFSQDKIEKYADVMVWGLETARQGGKLHPYETVRLRYHQPALPLAEAVHRKLLEKRLNVVLRGIPNPAMEKDFYSIADDKQLKFVAAGEKEFHENLAGFIVLRAQESLTHLKDVDPKKFGAAAVAQKPLRNILDRREERGKFSWTLCTFPTQAPARQAGISLKEYAAQIEKACFLHEKNPVAKWKALYKDCAEIKNWLASLAIQTLHIESKDTDLEVLLGEKRRFLGV